MNNELMFSSKKDDWRTPIALFRELDAEFHFTVDLCASDEYHLCEKYYTQANDGLLADVRGERVFCNPPYGRKSTSEWVRKCATCGADVVVMLIPARTDTKAFHDYIWNKAEIRFLRGRLQFLTHRGVIDRAPFPSMIVIFRKEDKTWHMQEVDHA